MKLPEHEREMIRDSFVQMSLPQKVEYIFSYYKPQLVLALIILTFFGSILYNRLTYKEVALYLAYGNVSVGDDLDHRLCEGFIQDLALDSRKNTVYCYRALYLSDDASAANHEYAYASQMKIMASMAAGKMDVILMNREAYDLMSAGNYLLPLSDLLSRNPALYAHVKPYLISNTVILKDNAIEHRLNEAIPYFAETEESLNAVCLSTFPLFEQAGFSGDVFLGIIGNSPRLDTVLRYIDYVTRSSDGLAWDEGHST